MGLLRIASKPIGVALRCATQVGELLIRLLGLILSTAAECLFFFVTYVYFRDLVGRVLEDYGVLVGLLLTGFGVWCLGNLHFNHLMAVFTKPGLPPGKKEVPSNARVCRQCGFLAAWDVMSRTNSNKAKSL